MQLSHMHELACAALLFLGGALGCSSSSDPTTLAARAGAAGADGNGGAFSLGGSAGGLVTGLPPDAGAAGSAAECERTVSLMAVTLGAPQPFDLIIVADHSKSLAWSRSQLSSGLHDLLTHVQGRAVRVFVLTPTQYGASSAAARMPLSGDSVVAWQDPETNEAYENAMTNYEEVCTDLEGASIACPSPLGPTPYEEQGSWRFAMPAPIAVIRPDMTDAEFSAEQNAVASAILAIGGNGSPHEQPLCTLSRYISQDPSLLPHNAVFLMISDEDDISLPRDCLAGFTSKVASTKSEAGSSPCTSNCDAYRYSAQGTSHAKSFSFNCAAFDDLGARIAGTEQMGFATQGSQASCDGIEAGGCSADEAQLVSSFCQPGKTLIDCQRDCSTIESSCTVELHEGTSNPCSGPFSLGGGSYANLAAYCANQGSGWHDCSGGGVNLQFTTSLTGNYSPISLMPGTSTADIGSYFKTKANTVFKPNAYLLEGIVLAPQFSCSLGMGQSFATNLGQFIADRSHLFPLCQSYAPALDGVLSFAQGLIQNSFPLKLAADETVTLVRVLEKGGGERVLGNTSYSYNRATQTLELVQSALSSQDEALKVEVTSDCRPIIK